VRGGGTLKRGKGGDGLVQKKQEKRFWNKGGSKSDDYLWREEKSAVKEQRIIAAEKGLRSRGLAYDPHFGGN